VKLKALCFGVASAALVSFAAPRPAHADVHYDIGGQVGVARRILSAQTPLGDDAGPGPIFELRAHLALLPLVRVGAYLEHDISPISSGRYGGSRQFTAGGLHVRLLSPIPTGKLRLYLGVGVGYVGVYAPSYTSSTAYDANGNPVSNVFVQGSTGSFWEFPFVLGASYRVARHFDLTAELGLRIGVGFGGDVYNGRAGSAQTSTGSFVNGLDVEIPGYDQFSPTLTVGALFDL
jgi:hypothetical protein